MTNDEWIFVACIITVLLLTALWATAGWTG